MLNSWQKGGGRGKGGRILYIRRSLYQSEFLNLFLELYLPATLHMFLLHERHILGSYCVPALDQAFDGSFDLVVRRIVTEIGNGSGIGLSDLWGLSGRIGEVFGCNALASRFRLLLDMRGSFHWLCSDLPGWSGLT